MNYSKKKQELVTRLSRDFNAAEGVFVMSCALSGQETQKLRKKLQLAGARLTIAKNTILRLVAQKVHVAQPLIPSFSKQIMLVITSKDSTKVAALIKENKAIIPHCGLLEGKFIDAVKFSFIASIPSKDILYARLCGILKSPFAKLVLTLKAIVERGERSA